MKSGMTLKRIASELPGGASAQYEIWHQDGEMILTETVKVHVRHMRFTKGERRSLAIAPEETSTINQQKDQNLWANTQ